MLAPNDEKSALNKTQWIQVRTQAFKDWFGDWESQEEIKQLGDISEQAKEIYNAFKDAGDYQPNVFQFLTNRDTSASIIKNAAVREEARRVKQVMMDVGQKLVDRGLLDADTYEDNKGQYLPRLYLRHLLDDNAISALGSGKKPSNLGYLKARKDIPEDVRRLILGEITNPGYLASKGFGMQMRDVALLEK